MDLQWLILVPVTKLYLKVLDKWGCFQSLIATWIINLVQEDENLRLMGW